MYDKITNPKTGRYVSVKGAIGKTVLKNYLIQLGSAIPIHIETPAVPSHMDEKNTLVFCHGNATVDLNACPLSDGPSSICGDRFQDQKVLAEILSVIGVEQKNVLTMDIDEHNEPDIIGDYQVYIYDLVRDKDNIKKIREEETKTYIFMSCPISGILYNPLGYFLANNAKKLVITNFFDTLTDYGLEIDQLIHPIIEYINLNSDDKLKLNVIKHTEISKDILSKYKIVNKLRKKLIEKVGFPWSELIKLDDVSIGTSHLHRKLVNIFKGIKYFTKINSQWIILENGVNFLVPAKYGIISEPESNFLVDLNM